MKNYVRSVLFVLALSGVLRVAAQTPVYSSHPSASAVLFLDFDGHTVTNTSWNYAGPIVCGASGLNSTQITTVFNRVAEDYRPFNINVTTDSTKYWAAPATMRMRVILTVTSEWYGSAGGVAFMNSFTWGDNTPCFVFSALLNYNVKYIAEAASHEAGHTMGLYHQSTYDANCNLTSQYNYGQGSGEIGWAPIMGVGYYQNFTIWHNGPNPYGCTSYQNELTVLTSNNGFSYRTDDHSAAFNQATQATFTNNVFNVNGVIERNTDQDMFRFTQPAYGRFLLTATPYNVGTGNAGSDLDMQVTLYNGSQTQLNVYNPGTLLSSIVDTFLNAGNYYLKVEGRGNAYAPNYASLGSYSMQGSLGGGTLPLRRLVLYGALNGERHQFEWLIDADEQVTDLVLEWSTDGRNFSPVADLPNNARQYTYQPNLSGAVQYRLNVTFDNGRQYYSNIVTLRRHGNDPRPQLVGTVVSSSLTISSPVAGEYQIFDYTGKGITRGRLTTGIQTVNSSQLAQGMYVIRFSNGQRTWTEKFVRQ
ncbi:MAG TPA: zinc-dependent metalloprotease [Chitinophagaceae bacterium]|nr:zinc-dependent metalloprotease [Chitinophagaceae bacterium]